MKPGPGTSPGAATPLHRAVTQSTEGPRLETEVLSIPALFPSVIFVMVLSIFGPIS